MSKRDALRALGKRFPAPSELTKTLDAAYEQPDRSAAIVATAIIESILEKIIVARLKHKEPDLIGKLFKDRGPLSDFHSKILVATAFGVISPNMGSELHRIKAIRNVFAHAKIDVNFDTPEIAEEVNGFLMLKAMQSVASDSKDISVSNKRTFILMIRILCIMISTDHKTVSGEELVI
ncbi:MAG: hypothetical protein G4V63_07615 [Candidatus Afipia apatlaquensis]|uniref:DUF4145 domain-containing protein n=1 Tax=Candidatus Afipia apatlaquensis TaxID=2712852 RepID=A0A7C9VGA7_9BRAD|nr:hypothetical protein [Candidatus Afipia apatlaquensis]